MYEETHTRSSADFLAEVMQSKEMTWYIQSDRSEKPQPRILYLARLFIQIWWRDQKIYRQAKSRRAQHHQTSFYNNYLRDFSKQKGRPQLEIWKLLKDKSHWQGKYTQCKRSTIYKDSNSLKEKVENHQCPQ